MSTERRASKAVENLKRMPGKITVDFIDGQVLVYTEKLKVSITDNFMVDIFDLNGKRICSDYRGEDKPFVRRGNDDDGNIAAEEGHQLEEERKSQKIKILKQLNPGSYFYGLGDRTGHLNKLGYHYKMWNTDNPNPHVESFETMYKSIPFFVALEKKPLMAYFSTTVMKRFLILAKKTATIILLAPLMEILIITLFMVHLLKKLFSGILF
ncbi:hypothetical protein [Oenococcus oeni]|uniref:hypothetical protein n=1 Tax=Oenococcus oeni TaxID=1247 RepID=UPI0030C7026F